MTPRPTPPDGWERVLSTFGDIFSYIREDGTLDPSWESDKITRVSLPVTVKYAFDPKVIITRVTCHKSIALFVKETYEEIYQKGAWQYLGPYGGGFVFRTNKNSPDKISLHSLGIAWDWSPKEFPNGSTKKRNPLLAKILRARGFTLGEDFHHVKDPMHFQFATNA